MYSLGVAYTSLSLARSSTYFRSASVSCTLRLLLKIDYSIESVTSNYYATLAIDVNSCQCGADGLYVKSAVLTWLQQARCLIADAFGRVSRKRSVWLLKAAVHYKR
jgi:hypothetical protein